MRVRVGGLVAALMIGLLGSVPSQAQVTNLITNGGFESGQIAPYGTYGTAIAVATATVVTDCAGANVPEGPIEGKYCLHVMVTAAGTNNWDAGMTQATLTWQSRQEIHVLRLPEGQERHAAVPHEAGARGRQL